MMFKFPFSLFVLRPAGEYEECCSEELRKLGAEHMILYQGAAIVKMILNSQIHIRP